MTPGFVMDASVAAAWCFPEASTPAIDALLDRMEAESAVVPAGWYLEVTHLLAVAERKGRLTPAQVAGFIALVEDLQLHVDDQAPGRAFTQILSLCRAHRLSSRDAVYLDLALRRQLPLASLNDELRSAAKAVGVEVIG
ncbi:MAG TPA: type II toxin-antitoxin system VapC family toxin [Phycisphaerae bacterium]|nr:type II toxin-antitoxin system VapC family toxin [Phycisphaerae bacterium]HOJ75299.1 type II toxin-antitoxin system VapC family toxin [Phycisphaerae bacterium]HOM53036.1 type II toxin-antitoxin system VapC family toxin [Phycisphaerae bacterium]HOQ87365.1 type II toxin-antitoxin system VapC family toxin [Phycisphaerae bacterium]HPP28199.1 type II toxin-antitoxin system VapC family toxin [Phycisphaerae bacterium]